MKIEFDWPDSVPQDQIDIPYIQGMLNRMAVGFHNYGHMRRYEKRSNSLKNILIRLIRYAGWGNIEDSLKEIKSLELYGTYNTEFLMDAANYCMMEFCVPSYQYAFFKATNKQESPGAIVDGKHVKGKEDYDAPLTSFQQGKKQKQVREGD